MSWARYRTAAYVVGGVAVGAAVATYAPEISDTLTDWRKTLQVWRGGDARKPVNTASLAGKVASAMGAAPGPPVYAGPNQPVQKQLGFFQRLINWLFGAR